MNQKPKRPFSKPPNWSKNITANSPSLCPTRSVLCAIATNLWHLSRTMWIFSLPTNQNSKNSPNFPTSIKQLNPSAANARLSQSPLGKKGQSLSPKTTLSILRSSHQNNWLTQQAPEMPTQRASCSALPKENHFPNADA